MTSLLAQMFILSTAYVCSEAENKNLEPLAFLIGTWEGEGEYLGTPFRDRITYEWRQKGNFIRYQYRATAGENVVWSEEGYYAFDTVQRKIVSFQFGRDGSLGRAVAVPSKLKQTFVMQGSASSPNPCIKNWRSILTRCDKDHYTVLCERKRGEKYEVIMKIRYSRKR